MALCAPSHPSLQKIPGHVSANATFWICLLEVAYDEVFLTVGGRYAVKHQGSRANALVI